MSEPLASSPPVASVTRRIRFSLLWLVPIVCTALGIYLGVRALVERGPSITITFKSADGIVPGQTEIRHKNVVLGTVGDVTLSPDLSHVVVHVSMARRTQSFLTDHARFWVVRPRLTSLSSLGAELNTLVTGAYIEVDPGAAGGRSQRVFEGLEQPPGVRSDEPGSIYALRTKRLGSLGPGAPVFFHDMNVGELLSTELVDADGTVAMRIFVRAPYDGYVHADTQFWNASGLSVSMGADGIKVELESLQALATGGIAFDSPAGGAQSAPPAQKQVFDLHPDEGAAKANFYDQRIPYVAYFESNVQGLGAGSAVQIFGVQVGVVTDVRLVPDRLATGSPSLVRVAFDIQPQRVGAPASVFAPDGLRPLVARGLRVVLDSTSLLTGQKVLSLQYVTGVQGGKIEPDGNAYVLPSRAGGLDNAIASLADVAAKLDRVPIAGIGTHLDDALRSMASTFDEAQQLVHEANGDLGPAMQKMPAIADEMQQAVARVDAAFGEKGYGSNSDFQRSMKRLLDQADRAARTIRLLADFLDRHPEAIIRGRATSGGAP